MPVDHYFSRSWELGDLNFVGIEPKSVFQIAKDSDIEKTQSINQVRLPTAMVA